jgi:hypothetical protein
MHCTAQAAAAAANGLSLSLSVSLPRLVTIIYSGARPSRPLRRLLYNTREKKNYECKRKEVGRWNKWKKRWEKWEGSREQLCKQNGKRKGKER